MSLKNNMGESWYNQLSSFIDSDAFKEIATTLKGATYYPRPGDLFKAFRLTPYEDVRVVILGMDPYPGSIVDSNKQHIPYATGLAFGIPDTSLSVAKSLENIRTEIEQEYDKVLPNFDITLESWAKQGVLLINTALTVEPGKPGSHASIWKPFTQEVIKQLGYKENLIWVLWGNHAKSYKKYIDETRHQVLESGHPSPLSANKGHWFGNMHFKQINDILITDHKDIGYIKWFETLKEEALF